jgi:hypothetical protein
MTPYLSIDALIALIDERNRSGCARILADHGALFRTVWGSTNNHQAWPGGALRDRAELATKADHQRFRMAHLCDVASARLWFDHPAAVNDPWTGATRCAEQAIPAATDGR